MNRACKRFTGISLACAIFCGSMLGAAQAREGRQDFMAKVLEQIAPEKRGEAQAILEENLALKNQYNEAIRAKRAELGALMRGANPDKAKIESIAREIGELRGKELAAKVELRAKLKQAGIDNLEKGKKGGKDFGKRGKGDDFGKDGDRGEGPRNVDKAKLDNLTPEQQAAFKKIAEQNREATAPLRKDLRAKQAEIDAQMKSETPDAAKLQALSTEAGEIRGKLYNARLAMRQDLEKAGLPADLLQNAGKDRPGKAERKGGK